ncbi:lytic transglycosylase domain-containing protein [Achromobacter sp. NFACC18-2]|uniref:lytic transglycosylase domain-containing protein n=1 Tax=Achromobacter sp. NFACC18-2 TaxID=1564112 RepID=UPI0008B0D3D0|nr:lytic transglycosylase domain-containing protein [Achromobacter sp. NFACC18-2]SEI59551.1 Transglycosylase SLT domain-containing protein [Achromobacter sp. NFACC18-2]
MSTFILRSRHWLGAALLLSCSASLAADVYVSFDDQGMAHFAPTALDDSYRLLFRDLSTGARGARRAAEPSPEIRQALEQAAQRHGLDYALLHAVAQAESGFDTHAVSPKGAVGVMQLMPATASQYGVPGTDEALQANLRKLDLNVNAGSRYLRALLDRYDGNLELALAAYNAGEGAVQRAGNRVPDYAETRNYVSRIMAAYQPGAPKTGIAVADNSGAASAMWTRQDDAKAVRQFEQGFMVVPPRKR